MARRKVLSLAAFFALCTATLLTGCAVEQGKVTPAAAPAPKVEAPRQPAASFCLLPQRDGKVGKIIITSTGGERTLTRANESVEVKDKGSAPGEPVVLTDAQIASRFGGALDALPPPPAHFVLYFEKDKPELTEASKPLVERIAAAIKERVGADVSIVGHTDTTGDKEHNFQLGLKRARAMVDTLTAKGLDLSGAQVASHGQENLLVQTGQGVDEPQNRRVEITVR